MSAETAQPTGPIPPDRLSRVLALLRYLHDAERGDQVPLAAIGRDLGLSPAEVENDLQLLNLVNHGGGTYVIFAEVDGEHVHVVREPGGDALARPARLSPLMAKALLLALDVVGDALPVSGSGDLHSARDKIAQQVAGLDRAGAVEVDDLFRADHDVISALNQALRTRRVVRLTYYTPSREELRTRPVEPYLLFHSGTGWYLDAFCRLARAQRTFRLDLIRDAALTDESFEPRDDVDLSLHRSGAVGPASGEASWAVIRFGHGYETGLRERGVELETLEDGGVRARIPYVDRRWLVREVLRYGGDAVLEEPDDVRMDVAATATVLLKPYADDPDPR